MAEIKDFAELNGIKYEWLGQSTVRIATRNGFTVYTDPVMLDENFPKADLILITHHHVDHCLPEFVAMIREEKTKIASFHESYLKYCVEDIKGVRTVKIGQTIALAGVRITGVEACAKRGFHIKGEGCGFLVELGGQKIYFSGDTAAVKEMEELKNIDAAIVSLCDNIGAIDPKEIIEAIKKMKPRLFIPVHYTPADQPDPQVREGMFATKDPRFFTRKENPERFLRSFEGTGIEVAILRMLGRYKEE
ncbi:MAG TPA: MBL fold metallo-hydrolase [Thermodesulfobacteriota bacterium]|nr:MBL fold metallo-hydrolase [Thermodesulfobacteriota bacterium]